MPDSPSIKSFSRDSRLKSLNLPLADDDIDTYLCMDVPCTKIYMPAYLREVSGVLFINLVVSIRYCCYSVCQSRKLRALDVLCAAYRDGKRSSPVTLGPLKIIFKGSAR